MVNENSMNENLRALRAKTRRVQGTDGVRGKIDETPLSPGESLLVALRESRLTPGFFRLYAQAFGELLLESGTLESGDVVLVAGDGRDFHRGGRFRAAFFSGIQAAGLEVVDAGVLPTPGVPLFAVAEGLRAAAVLTASHNPANQNGIKLFIDGFKLLPESGAINDTSLTEKLFELALSAGEDIPDFSPEPTGIKDCSDAAKDFFISSVIDNLPPAPAGAGKIHVVFDPANGACAFAGKQILERLGIEYVSVNDAPDGENINRDGGVAELEGASGFDGKGRPVEELDVLPVVRKLFETGRDGGDLRAGLVTDGDGDRGFLLLYLPDEDRVAVLSGDNLAYLLLKFRHGFGRLEKGSLFLFTVESDLNLGACASRNFHVEPIMTCVGDKWLASPFNPELESRQPSKLALASEESGHIIIPLWVSARGGENRAILAGNGMLSCLEVLLSAAAEGIEAARLVKPYVAGLKSTAYVYFVKKSLFRRGSRLWAEDEKIAAEVFEQARRNKLLPAGANLESLDFPQDPDMLYLAVKDAGGQVIAAVFARNSGTENKQSIYARGDLRTKEFSLELLKRLQEHHKSAAKDESLPESRLVAEIIETLSKGALDADALFEKINKASVRSLDRADFNAVVYGLRKEGTLAISGRKLQIY